MIKAIFTNSFGILLSRILGFVRDMLSASILGANIYSDIFFVAFKLPNLFRRIFAEGAFTTSFLPSFTAARYKSVFVVQSFFWFSLTVAILCIFVQNFSYEITRIVVPGFDAKTAHIAAPLVAINFYYLLLIFIVSFLSGLLHYKRHFATTAFSTAFLNIAIIVALALSKDLSSLQIIYYMSYGVLIGGILQVLAHIVATKQLGFFKLFCVGIKSKKRHSLDLKRFRSSFVPAVFGASASHISAFLDTFLASFLVSGSISYLYYANRILQLPLALFAIATSMALFPSIARYISNSNTQEALKKLGRAFWILMYLLCVCTLGGIIFSEEIIALLFERGAFDEHSRLATASVLNAYMIGLVPFGLAKIFSLWLYAHHKQKRAAAITAKSLFVNIVFALFLIRFGTWGLALASSIGGITLFVYSLKELGWANFKPMLNARLSVGLVATLAILFFVFWLLKPFVRSVII